MKKIIALVLAMAFVVAACSSSTEDAVTTYCDDLANLKTSLQDLSTLSASSTVEDLTDAKDAVKSAYDDTVKSAEGVDDAVLKDLEDARNEWQKEIDAIPSDATIEEAAAAVGEADDAYVGAIDATLSTVNCSS